MADGHALAVIELCESALSNLETAAGAFDDSDGHLSVLEDRLEDIHFQACKDAGPDPLDLARRLFNLELCSDLGVFWGAAANYAEILGVEGLKEYRRVAEAEWAKVPAWTPNEPPPKWGNYSRIERIMQSLAQASGNVEELVGVMSRDLTAAYNYLRIAEVYREAGRHDHALIWAEKGLQAFPEQIDSRLQEFVAEGYHRRSRHEEAMRLIWGGFLKVPDGARRRKADACRRFAPTRGRA